jgi:hypothetical protein
VNLEGEARTAIIPMQRHSVEKLPRLMQIFSPVDPNKFSIEIVFESETLDVAQSKNSLRNFFETDSVH